MPVYEYECQTQHDIYRFYNVDCAEGLQKLVLAANGLQVLNTL